MITPFIVTIPFGVYSRVSSWASIIDVPSLYLNRFTLGGCITCVTYQQMLEIIPHIVHAGMHCKL